MHFSLEKLINYKGNRYLLAKACIGYAKKVRFLEPDEYQKLERKDALVSLKHVLDEDVKYLLHESELFAEEDDDLFAAEDKPSVGLDQEGAINKRQPS